MNPIKIVFIWIVLLSLSACGGGSGSTAASNTSAKTYQGVVQKGPFIIGTDVQVSLLDISGVATRDAVTVKIIDNKGTFEYQIPSDWSRKGLMLEISTQGIFLNELSGQNSTHSVLLTALTNNPENSSVNLLTHWVNNRTKALIQSGQSLKNAYVQANNEAKLLLGIDTPNQLDFTVVSENSESSALLLLLSGSLMEVANQDSENLNAIIAQISSDFSEDGILNLKGGNWLKQMQAKIRDNPSSHTDVYATNLKQGIDSEIVSGNSLPRLIPLASRPVAIAPAVIFAKPGETIFLDGSASHDSGELINFTWFRVDQQTQFNVPVSDRFAERPSITVPSQESEILYALVVTDVDKLTDTTVVKVIVKIPPVENTPPIAESQTSTNSVITDEDTPVNITLIGSDPDGDPISFVITTPLLLPNGLLQGTAPNLTYTPTQDFFGADSFTFFVNDGSANSNIATIDIIVNSINDLPVANAGPDQSKQSSESVSLNGSGTDVDGTIASYFWMQTAGSPVMLSDDTIAAPSFTAPVVSSIPETLTFQLVVTDNDGASSIADSMDVVVSSLPNVSPTANAGIDRTTQVNQSITITGSGTDSDGTIASYEWRLGATVLATTASFSYTPTAVGTDTLSLTVTDNDGATSIADTMDVVVTATPNVPPTANAGPNQTVISSRVNLGAGFLESTPAITLDGSGSSDVEDPNVNLTFNWTQISGPVTIDPTDIANVVQPTFTIASTVLNEAIDGDYVFQLIVTDTNGADSVADDVTITVSATANLPPDAIATFDGVEPFNEGTQVQLRGSESSDDDGTIISYLWQQIGSPSVTISDPTIDDPTFIAPVVVSAPLTLSFSLTVTDNNGATASEIVTIDINGKPVANQQDQTLTSSSLNLTLSGSDPEGGALTYKVTTLPTNGTLSGVTVNVPFSSPNLTYSQSPTALIADSFIFTVIDNTGFESSPATVNLLVGNNAPIASSQSLTIPSPVGLDIDLHDYASDPDGDAITFELVGTPSQGGIILTFSASFSTDGKVNAFPLDTGVNASFQYKVIDENGAESSTETISIVF